MKASLLTDSNPENYEQEAGILNTQGAVFGGFIEILSDTALGCGLDDRGFESR
jgi:acyl-coenzyme A thioesterase PaaI-like protein